ncbi:MAG: amino acid adenylation domain-containing protein [Candidatus Magnetomorum sp.]|nr:amino acid adenylation domain-containing protein [Candidatus Magnetomorum sp.]
MFAKKNIKNIYALTPMQEGMLFQTLYDKESLSYFEQYCFHISDHLDVPVFKDTWNEIMRRHDILRTIFVHKNVPQPLQIVLKIRDIDFHYEDISTLSKEGQEVHYNHYKDKDKQTQFDLSKDVLMRIAVFKLDETSFNIIWTFHHILLDGWSTGIIYEELNTIYNAFKQGEKPNLNPPVSFSHYIRWLKGQNKKTAKSYWKKYLSDYKHLTTLPRKTTDQRNSFIEKNIEFELDETMTQALQNVASKNQITINTVIQVIWGILLTKYNALEDIVFGATVSGRPADIKDIERMVGILINAIPVRIKIAPEQPFSELLKRVHLIETESRNYHYYSLADILTETCLKQNLFDHILVFENYPDPGEPGKNLKNQIIIDNFEVYDHTHFDLTLIISPEKNTINFSITYNQSVYDHVIIEKIQPHLELIIKTVTNNHTITIESIDILSQNEKEFYVQARDHRNTALSKQLERLDKHAGNVSIKYKPPENEHQKKLADIWEEILDCDAVGIDDNFFESGGHSLMAMQIIARIHKIFDVEISINTFFDNPNIRLLSNIITNQNISKYLDIEKLHDRPFYDVSHSQRRLWILDKMEDGLTAYNLSMGFMFKGLFNVKAFKRSIEMTINRHESLRTTFIEIDGEPRQKINKHLEVEFKEIDLRDQDNNKIIAKEIAKEESNCPYDLKNGPLLKIGLLWLSNDCHVILMNIHHIICDGWSLGVLENEILFLYKSFVHDKKIELPPLNIQYRDYTAWQNKILSDENVKAHQHYWHDKLSGELPVLNLPMDHQRGSVQTYNGNTLSHIFTKELTSKLEIYCRNNEVSLFMTLLTALKTLLYRYTGQEDIIIGSPIAGRNHPDLEDQIGFYVNTLALRDQINGNDSFKKLLKTVKQTTIDAYEHQVYPFDRLVEELNVQRDVSRSPIFDSMMVLQNNDIKEIKLDDLEISHFEYETGISQFDITLNFITDENKLCLYLNYNSDIFEKDRMIRFALHFEELLKNILHNDEQLINKLNILTASEKQQILFDFNDTKTDYPADKTIVDLFEEQVEKTPDNSAIIYKNKSITYKELNQAANALAHHLLDHYQIQPDDLVGVMADRSEKMIISLLGILKAGGAYLPIDPAYPQQRIDYMKKDSACRVLLSEKDFRLETCNINNPQNKISIHNLAYVIYTSGSTGRPKGVMIEQGGFVNMCLAQISGFNISESDHVLQFASPSFDASLSEIFMALLKGAALVPVNKEIIDEPEDFLNYLSDNQVTVITFPPVYLNMLNKHPLPTVKTIITAGEAAVISDVAFYSKNKHYFNAYGPTESSVCASFYKIDPEKKYNERVPIGKPIANSSIFILDEAFNPVPVGVPGEIYFSGIGLARGYLNRPDLTKEKFIDNPFSSDEILYKTGDSGQWLPDGNIEFLGRKDDQVKIRGHRIELGEIENRLQQHPLIKDALVLAIKTDRNTKELVSYLITPSDIVIEELRSFLKETLPDFFIPAYFVQLEKFPLTVNGKIDKKNLPDPQTCSDLISDNYYVPPQNEREEKLVRIWQNLFNNDKIGIYDNFFALGGDSIRAIQLVSRLQQENLTLKARDIFQYPTIAQLSKKVIQSTQISQEHVTGVVPVTAITGWFFKEYCIDRHHFNHSQMFYAKEGFDEKALRAVFSKIHEHHDALRMTYKYSDNKLIQEIKGLDHPLDFQKLDLRDSDTPDENLRFHTEQFQTSVDLENGPLMKVILFRLNDGDRLLMILHHLIVDGVSWRILLEDIISGYHQYLSKQSIMLPLKTNSFKRWAEKIQLYSTSDVLFKEKKYWQKIESTPVKALPYDDETENELMKNTSVTSFTLSPSETYSLMTEASQIYRTGTEVILLTGLAYAMKQWHGDQKTLITLEAHGRRDIIADLDVSRTVGWFTSTYPVILESPDVEDIFCQIETIKQLIESIPEKGIGYSILKYVTPEHYKNDLLFHIKPEINFNYLGQFDEDNTALFQIADESPGHSVSKNAKIIHHLDFNAIIEKQSLHVYLMFNNKRYRKETIETILANFKYKLQAILK